MGFPSASGYLLRDPCNQDPAINRPSPGFHDFVHNPTVLNFKNLKPKPTNRIEILETPTNC